MFIFIIIIMLLSLSLAAATSEKIKLVKEIFFRCWIMLVYVREEICRHVGTHLTHIYRHFCLLLHRRALCSIFLFYATTTLQQPSALTHSLSPRSMYKSCVFFCYFIFLLSHSLLEHFLAFILRSALEPDTP